MTEWISVKDRLPDNANHPGGFCPRCLVYTDFGITEGITEGWYNPDKGCWYGYISFMTDVYEIWNVDLDRGDVPKTVKNIPVKYWMPLPEPPKGVNGPCSNCQEKETNCIEQYEPDEKGWRYGAKKIRHSE